MPNLLTATITTPVTNAVTPMLQRRTQRYGVILQGNFIYGSGGTSVDAWVQTSIDGGATWCDVANFHFVLASLRQIANLSSLTPVAPYTPTDGTLAANTVKDGLIGDRWRVKYTSVGTFGGNTQLMIDLSAGGFTP
jgi:hypothetical protein